MHDRSPDRWDEDYSQFKAHDGMPEVGIPLFN